jgi:hypothetical protein
MDPGRDARFAEVGSRSICVPADDKILLKTVPCKVYLRTFAR